MFKRSSCGSLSKSRDRYQFRTGFRPQGYSTTADGLATRDAVSDFINALANTPAQDGGDQRIQARGLLDIFSSIVQEFGLRDTGADELVARNTVDYFIAAALNSRDSGPEQAIQAHSLWTDVATEFLANFFKRDATPNEFAARDSLEDFMAAVLSSRDFDTDQAIQVRS